MEQAEEKNHPLNRRLRSDKSRPGGSRSKRSTPTAVQSQARQLRKTNSASISLGLTLLVDPEVQLYDHKSVDNKLQTALDNYHGFRVHTYKRLFFYSATYLHMTARTDLDIYLFEQYYMHVSGFDS